MKAAGVILLISLTDSCIILWHDVMSNTHQIEEMVDSYTVTWLLSYLITLLYSIVYMVLEVILLWNIPL